MIPIRQHLDSDDGLLEERWKAAQERLALRFGKEPGIESMLFLMGIQSRGRGFEPEMGKDRKQDTIMEGTYCAFEKLGLYRRIGLDEDGFWIWERTVAEIPKLPLEDQEKLLKLGILSYLDEVIEQNAT